MSKKYNKVNKNKTASKTLRCHVEWNTKSITKDASGNLTVEGFANTMDKDRIGDVVYPSAFEASMKEYMDNAMLLYQHDWDKCIGKVLEYKIVDDENAETRGLWVKAQISNAKDVEDVRIKIKEGALKTFSIGYNELDSDYDKESNTNYVTEVELLEISVVTIPCNPFAKFNPSETEEESKDHNKTTVNKELLNFVADALKDLKDAGDITGEFLEEIINIYTGKEE